MGLFRYRGRLVFFLLKLVTGDVLVSGFKKPFRFIENRGIMVSSGSSLLLDRTKIVKIFGEKGSFGMVCTGGISCVRFHVDIKLYMMYT